MDAAGCPRFGWMRSLPPGSRSNDEPVSGLRTKVREKLLAQRDLSLGGDCERCDHVGLLLDRQPKAIVPQTLDIDFVGHQCPVQVLRVPLSRLKDARRAAEKVLDFVQGLKLPAEQYFTFLLARTPDTGLGSVEADFLVTLCAPIGSSRALELIDESGAGDSVVPLAAALQMDLRQGSPHAQEIQEVATDILHRINRTRELFGKAERALSSTEFSLRFDSIGGRLRRWLGDGKVTEVPSTTPTPNSPRYPSAT